MSERTLREVLRDAIDRVGEPTLALFTTFNFDPVFFEDYVLPVFCEGLDATTMSGVLAADRFLRSMATVVFHDADQLAQGRKRLSYGTVPVRPEAHNFFHPKLIVLGNDDGEFLLIVGSANLTVSGWGRNHEVITTPVDVPAKSYVSLTLFRTLEWLRDYAQAQLRGVDGEAEEDQLDQRHAEHHREGDAVPPHLDEFLGEQRPQPPQGDRHPHATLSSAEPM